MIPLATGDIIFSSALLIEESSAKLSVYIFLPQLACIQKYVDKVIYQTIVLMYSFNRNSVIHSQGVV